MLPNRPVRGQAVQPGGPAEAEPGAAPAARWRSPPGGGGAAAPMAPGGRAGTGPALGRPVKLAQSVPVYLYASVWDFDK